jgi:hypothetical protein
MPKITYDLIEPNIAETEITGPTVRVTWKCPITRKIVGQTAADMQAATSTARNVSVAVQKSLIDQGFRFVNDLVARMFGGMASQVSAAATHQARAGTFQQVGKPQFNKAAEYAAVVAAFEQIQQKFRWDEDREHFVAAE